MLLTAVFTAVVCLTLGNAGDPELLKPGCEGGRRGRCGGGRRGAPESVTMGGGPVGGIGGGMKQLCACVCGGRREGRMQIGVMYFLHLVPTFPPMTS